ncbi:hypothetical protein Tco_0040860 [Tanacetum coccineum]
MMNSTSLAYTTLKRLGTEVQEELHHNERPTIQRLPVYYTPSAAIDAPIPKPTLEDLAATAPSTKVLAKAEDSKKSAMAHAVGGIAQKSLFVHQTDHDDDADDRAEISLITLIRSATNVPLGGNQGEGYAPSPAEVPSNLGSQGKAIMDDYTNIPSGSVDRPQGSTSRSSSIQGTVGDTIYRDLFPPLPGPYYVNYPKDGIIGGSYQISHKEWELPHKPTFDILNKELFKYPKVCETVVSDLKKQVVVLNEKVTTSDVALVKAKGKSKDHKKRVKSLTKSLDQFTVEATRLASDLNETRRADARKSDQIVVA